MAVVSQQLRASPVGDTTLATRRALETVRMEGAASAGGQVAVAVGSRGITGISQIVAECVGFLKERGFCPFIVPAMGSHGGNTTQGERAILADLGIDEASMGIPIRTSTAVERIDSLDGAIPVLMAHEAAQADHLIVINRIKPHTKFRDLTESGITKMLTIGLGRGEGARVYHRAAVDHTFSILRRAAESILGRHSVLFGLAVVEDGYKNTAEICAIPPGNWFEEEHRLLEKAREMMPRIPFDPLDILIVDEIGKDISGIGMDSNITGRHRDLVGDFFEPPHVKRIFVRDLSRRSQGNGNGIGLADVTTQRLVDALDLDRTYANAITAISPEKAALPIHFSTDRECLNACLETIGQTAREAARIVHIRNTLTLHKMKVSRALAKDVAANPDLLVIGSWHTIAFDTLGNMEGLAR